MTCKSTCVFAILVVAESIVGLPFESTTITNGLSYFRTREFHHGGFVYPNSQLGMNQFSGRTVLNDEVEEALYGCVRFLKYVYPRIEDKRSECWTPNGFLKMNNLESFPDHPRREIIFKEHDTREIRVVAFPFEVKNVLSEKILKVILVKMFFKEDFLGALYYNCNTSDVGFSFVDVSGNTELVGQESNAPYLSYDERKIQKELLDDMLKRFVNVRRLVPQRTTTQSQCRHVMSTNHVKEVEVIGPDL